MDLLQFMGDSHGEAATPANPTLDFARVWYVRLDGDFQLLNPNDDDYHYRSGFPPMIVFGTHIGADQDVVDHLGATIVTLAAGEVGVLGIYTNLTGVRKWIGRVFTEL